MSARLGSLLVVAAIFAPVIVVASLVDPSVEVTGSTSGICDNSGGTLNPNIPTLLTYSSLSSDEAVMSIAGVGIVATTDEDLAFFPAVESPGSFGLNPSPYSVPPGTAVTVTITTYTGPGLTGSLSFESTVVFLCDTGEIVSLVSGPPVGVPALSPLALAVLAGLLALVLTRRLQRSPS